MESLGTLERVDTCTRNTFSPLNISNLIDLKTDIGVNNLDRSRSAIFTAQMKRST